MAARIYRNRGSVLWDFTAHFIAARSQFLSIYRRYERRVIRSASDRGVDRTVLVLPPQELWKLFHLGRLQSLRDDRLAPMRALADRIFGEQGDEGLMDAYCRHIFHEVAILVEEHQSVGRFVLQHDPRRYRELFNEVSGYYPMRLRRVRRFFQQAMRRLNELLPEWAEERVMIRCAYLFGERQSRRAYGRGREALLQRMFPEGGEILGYLSVGRSFQESGFLDRARDALDLAATWGEKRESSRPLDPIEIEALAETQERLRQLSGQPETTAVEES
jgi:hypothetical protein